MRPIPSLIFLGLALAHLCCVAHKKVPSYPWEVGSESEQGFRRPITIEEAERKYLVSNPKLGKDPVPFGFNHARWLEFKAKIQPGDTLIEFYVPPMGEVFHPYAGFEIERNGKTIDVLITIT
jgi:hypothetical protein